MSETPRDTGADEPVEPNAAAPAEDAPTADAPAEDAPAAEAPAEDAPAAEAPAEDAPTGDAPAEDAPAAEAPAEDAPAADDEPAAPKAARRKKEPEPEPVAAPGQDAEEAPRPPRRRRTKAEKKEPTAAESSGVAKEAAQTAAKADDRAEHKGAKQPAARSRRAGRREAQPGLVVRAQARYVRTSARKARLVCDHIRGKSVTEARAILAHTPRAVARDWAKLLESAVANAEHNHELVGDELHVMSVTADEGPTIKRFRPRAMGRASKINKRTAHLTIQLTAAKEAK